MEMSEMTVSLVSKSRLFLEHIDNVETLSGLV